MTFDTIAFTQDELDNALNLCCTSIGLCDNDFILPQIAGVTYISIGEISAKAKFKKDDMKKHNINCIGFVPQFAPQICEHSPSVSSYITSYITSYQYEYEYEYITSNMDAIHINWTKPFRNRFNVPYEVEDFEILTTILSALKWREKNGNIKMVTDSVGAQYYKKTGLDVIWNSVENILDNVDVNSNVFWAAGKIFALKEQNAPVAMIDTDFIVWEKIDEEKLADVSVIHFENLYPDVYPPIDFFHMDNYEFDNDFDWNIKACNTAFCVIKNEKLLRYYTDKSIEFMRHTSEQNDRLAYMVFAEQRMLPMCAKKLNMSIMSFSDLNRLFKNGDNMFTHTWGMKQQMRDNAFLRADFCRRCIKRIIRDYPEMKNIIMNIENLKQYF